jgi:hypothetical protein
MMSQLEDLTEDAIMTALAEGYPPELVAARIRQFATEIFQLGRRMGTTEAWQHYCETYGSPGQSDEKVIARQLEQTIPIILGEARKKMRGER